jgi:hypothetical protein
MARMLARFWIHGYESGMAIWLLLDSVIMTSNFIAKASTARIEDESSSHSRSITESTSLKFSVLFLQ